MKRTFKYMTLLAFCLCFLFSCSDGGGTIMNPFENGEDDNFIKIIISSNADTLHLSWELTDTKVSFDSYRVELDNPQTIKIVDKNNTEFIFTHIPYNEPVSVSISLIKDDEVVFTTSTQARIDGLDKEMSKVIIPDQGSVTGGDGMYSVLLPDGRSIFLMGDSYIGTVFNGQRSTSDHMYRNTYIIYDNGKVSAIYGANGNKKSSAAVPPNFPDEKKWYWPGHGFVDGNKLYIFQTLMYQGGRRYVGLHVRNHPYPGV